MIQVFVGFKLIGVNISNTLIIKINTVACILINKMKCKQNVIVYSGYV